MSMRGYFFISVFLIYILIISLVSIFKGGFVDAHTIVLFLFFFALLIGQSLSFLMEFVLFTIIIFAYQILRDYADDMEGYVNIDNIVRIEHYLFGNIPTVILQEKSYTYGNYHIYDFISFILWALHFVVPLALAFILWRYKKTLYRQSLKDLLMLHKHHD